jgi:hypothetical protein
MIQESPPVLKPTLEEVAQLFESWRNGKPGRRALPETLWQAAVILSDNYPLSKISRRLGLDYSDFKNRVLALPTKLPGNDPHPGFVELDLGRSNPVMECVVEMEEKNGSKTRMSVKGSAGCDLLELVKTFWSKGL